jgi:transcriptional regulator with XRE-family HTH domain
MAQPRPHEEATVAIGQREAVVAVADVPGTTRLGHYLKSLREGYGYTLRKVEERATALGEAIDNSQLSRFEKGKAVPSFDKLRALARVFNVPVQNFSDVLDLEQYEDLKPSSQDYEALIRDGSELMTRGDHGRAFVVFERALEVVRFAAAGDRTDEREAEARTRMASALRSLGKLFMTERELRAVLKNRGRLSPATRRRTLLQLSYLYRELGDLYLASVLARECLGLAKVEGDRLAEAGVLNTLANIEHDEGQAAAALDHYDAAREILHDLGGHQEMLATVGTNLGGCLVTLGRYEQGVRRLKEAYEAARLAGYRRVASLSLTRLAEAYAQTGDVERARATWDDSDSLASRSGDPYIDILFLNAYHRWVIAREQSNPTREKVAFGRLRHLRSRLQRKFVEVEEFDRYVERIRR